MMDELDLIDADLRISKFATDLVSEATGGNAYYIEQISHRDRVESDHLLGVLRAARVPLAAPLMSDIEEIFGGGEPRYFVSHDRLVERYRVHHYPGVSFEEPDFGARRLVDKDVIRRIKKELAEWHNVGVSLAEYRRGAACIAEQNFFYETDEWKDRSAVIRIIDRFTCRSCGRNARENSLHAHHDEHIYSAFSRHFYHNFDVVRLRCLCDRCHTEFHRSHVRGYSDFNLAEPQEISGYRAYRAAMERLHEAVKECQFCFLDNRRTG